ncbi:hypothetical protein [Streptomyces sp. IBSBF 2435]|uniref:hypothetical protein n=1 Tax=Streptomyces sp. IBSBF 2435 TaxID=2903531 RepID=UPI002FDB9B8C
MSSRQRGRPWRSLLATAGLRTVTVLGVGPQRSAQAYPAPVGRTDLINALSGISGAHTVSGIFQNPQTPSQWTQKYIEGRLSDAQRTETITDGP